MIANSGAAGSTAAVQGPRSHRADAEFLGCLAWGMPARIPDDRKVLIQFRSRVAVSIQVVFLGFPEVSGEFSKRPSRVNATHKGIAQALLVTC